MISLLADVNVIGHVARIVGRMQSEYWREFWEHLELRSINFAEAGIPEDAGDSQIWRRCQERQLILLTNNRNDDSTDSLETTIRTAGTSESLPIFTFRDADSILISVEYVDRVVASLFDQLLRIDEWRGAGRLWLP